MSSADIVRQLKIKTNSLKRLHKELSYYEKEREREASRFSKLKEDNADPHDLRQAVRDRYATGSRLLRVARRRVAGSEEPRGRSTMPRAPAAGERAEGVGDDDPRDQAAARGGAR